MRQLFPFLLSLFFVLPQVGGISHILSSLTQHSGHEYHSGLHAQTPSLPVDEARYASLEFRNIGPFRGGRSCAVTGVPGKPNLYYFGATGGGVWKTTDGGQSWVNISDDYFGGSIGSIAVSERDPNVIYVGGGEKTVRGNVSFGYGVWRTEDAGKTWQQAGLTGSRHISRLRIHPDNPQLVYAAVMGDLYKSSEERGVYRSTDGGRSWERILFANADAGAVDLVIDPTNPRILFASTWRIRRTPYSLESGGEGSSLWRSTDGGDNWEEIKEKPGLPAGDWGISGVAVSPVDGDRIYTIIENANGGVFVSSDGGDSWRKTNSSRALRQRAWYYTRIYADPQDIDGVYVMNVNYQHSTDGGRTFESRRAPHGDHHDLWIAPEDPMRMIIGDDGGAQVSFDGGQNWSTYLNQPTAQFYRVTTDNHFPYRIYGAQQDNSTVRIPHRTDGGLIAESDWESTAGGESAHLAIDPNDNDIVYGGSYGGYLTRYNHRTQQRQAINVWPDNPMGHGAEGMKYRFQWNFPVFFSPHDPTALYAASNHLHRSYDGGRSWEIISPDLTTNDTTKLGPSGGPITKDNTSVEYYCTIFAATESVREAGVLWTASDDGLVHISRDNGGNWTNVTPPDVPQWMMWNSVETDSRRDGSCYLAGTRYKLGDYTPYLYHTTDYGQTWRRIDNGIDREHFTRVLRHDPDRSGLLYAGTESGLYMSFNDGRDWQALQLNLPMVPITDLAVKEGNLVVATQGRSFWVLDDLSVLHQQTADNESKSWVLYHPTDAWRMGGSSATSRTRGQNHPGGLNIHYYLSDEVAKDSLEICLTILSPSGDTVRSWSTEAGPDGDKLEVEPGANHFNWNLRYPSGDDFKGMVLWWAGMAGPRALPGTYGLSLRVGEEEQTTDFRLKADPRATSSAADLQAQFDFMMSVQDKVSEAHRAISDMRELRTGIRQVLAGLEDGQAEQLVELGETMLDEIESIETTLYQTQNEARQDPLNFPIRLTNKLAHLNSLVGIGNDRPTQQSYGVRDELTAQIDAELARWAEVVKTHVPQFNQLFRESGVDRLRME
ncbi:MAG: glycosyl hydrolase [Bacteroidota bacterium]